MSDLQQYRTKGNAKGISTVVFEWALIAAVLAIAAAIESWWFYPFAVVVVGTRQYALTEVLGHEAAHRNLCETRWLNDLLGVVVCWPMCVVFSGYRIFHLSHHRVPLGGKENNINEEYEFWRLPEEDQPLSRARALWLFAVRPALGIIAAYHLVTVFLDLYYYRKLRESLFLVVFWLSVVMIAWQTGLLLELLLYWILPALYVMGALDYWSEVGDHYRVQGANTRSDLNPILNRLVSYNIGYHALHHRYPRIPWYHLPAAHAACKNEIEEQVSRGYLDTFKQVVST